MLARMPNVFPVLFHLIFCNPFLLLENEDMVIHSDKKKQNQVGAVVSG